MRILITGASGFVGRKACTYLNTCGHEVFAFSRSNCNFPLEIKLIKGESLSKKFSNPASLKGFECVIHLAGKTYPKSRRKSDSYSDYFKDNVEETLKLAKLCSKSSVKRFIFISSIKVNGDFSFKNKPFCEKDIPNPQDYYALSKHNAELGLLKIAKKSQMEVVIVRPPLIYGEGVKGYFESLLKLIKYKVPLPFGSFVNNKRSFIYLENFLNFIEVLIDHPKAGNEIFICSDESDISTADLFKELSYGMHKKNLILKVPRFLFLFCYLIGRGHLYKKLNESLTVDNSKCKNLLDWHPLFNTKKALKKVSKEYINNKAF